MKSVSLTYPIQQLLVLLQQVFLGFDAAYAGASNKEGFCIALKGVGGGGDSHIYEVQVHVHVDVTEDAIVDVSFFSVH